MSARKLSKEGKLSREEFTELAIDTMHDEKQKGILASKSGYFGEFEALYGEPPYTYTPKTKRTPGHYSGWLVDAIAAGKFEGHPVGSGTYAIFHKGDMPKKQNPVSKANQLKLHKLVQKALKA